LGVIPASGERFYREKGEDWTTEEEARAQGITPSSKPRKNKADK